MFVLLLAAWRATIPAVVRTSAVAVVWLLWLFFFPGTGDGGSLFLDVDGDEGAGADGSQCQLDDAFRGGVKRGVR
jgi:hypothetical protein